MNAQSLALGPATARVSTGGGMFLGFGTFFRKEIREWVRGRRRDRHRIRRSRRRGPDDAHPIHRQQDRQRRPARPLSMDPTDNVLVGWAGQTIAIIVLLASMSLLVRPSATAARLRWSLTLRSRRPASSRRSGWLPSPRSPSSPSSSRSAVSIGAATSCTARCRMSERSPCSAPCTWPCRRSMSPCARDQHRRQGYRRDRRHRLRGHVPSVRDRRPRAGDRRASPTAIGGWATAIATGQPASPLTPIGFLASMAILAVGAKLIFDRQEV